MKTVKGFPSHRFQCILFDLGSTLIYFDGEWERVFNQAIEALLDALTGMGIHYSRSTFDEAFRTRITEYQIKRDIDLKETPTLLILLAVLNDQGIDSISESQARSALDEFYRITQLHWIPEEDAYPTLNKLRAAGYRLGLISNAGDDNDVHVLVDKVNARTLFDLVLSSAACGIRKPDPQIFQIAMDQIGCSPNETIMVGDNLEADIQGAYNAGVTGIWITRRVDDAENLVKSSRIKPVASIESLEALPQRIMTLD